MRLRSGFLMLALLTVPGIATAEDVYKSLMPDGSVVYGESPQPGARKVEKIDARARISGAIVASPEEKQRAKDLGPTSAAVGVIPQAQRDPTPVLQQGAISAPGTMPKRGY